jgi:hypothetical protein
VSKELNLSTTIEHFRVEFVSAGNDWKQHPNGEEYLKRLREAGRGALAAKLESVWRPRVERWIAAAFASRGQGVGTSSRTLIESISNPLAQPARRTLRARPELIP